MVAVNLPDSKKGERIVLLVSTAINVDSIKKNMILEHSPALMNPSEVYIVDDVPKLGSGKTDFSGARNLALKLSNRN